MFGLFACLALFVTAQLAYDHPQATQAIVSAVENIGEQLAAVILSHNPRTIAQIKNDYVDTSTNQAKKVRILIVPGHNPDSGGAEFGSLKERNMTVELGQDLQKLLASNTHYQVFIARDNTAWSPELTSYFQNNWSDIQAWQNASYASFSHLVAIGAITAPVVTIDHLSTPPASATRLYGMTKWANENDIDIVLHIHFNDYAGRQGMNVGKYSGFAMYVPAEQYENSATTKAVAATIFNRLKKYNPVSNLPAESSGIVDDPELIALGSYDTADAASMLIEYGYIYEAQFTNPALRSTALNDLAFQTYLGLQDFFDPASSAKLATPYDTLVLPHTWNAPVTATNGSALDIFALQTALAYAGTYPPNDKTNNTCPRSGIFGTCTRVALQNFQTEQNITGENGFAGPQTIAALSALQ